MKDVTRPVEQNPQDPCPYLRHGGTDPYRVLTSERTVTEGSPGDRCDGARKTFANGCREDPVTPSFRNLGLSGI